MPPAEDLDFLLENGDKYAILGSGERVEPGGRGLPEGMGTHLVLGTARKGGVHVIGHVPGGAIRFDPTRRWLGVDVTGDGLHLFDTANGLRPGFRFEATGAIHPQGDLVACRHGDEIRLHAPDGHVLHSARFPAKGWPGEWLTFSACGEFLWFACTPPGRPAVLLLLRCPSLELADECPPSPEPGRGYWAELVGSVNPATGHLALRRQAGDDFIDLYFYKAEGGRIVRLDKHFTGTDEAGIPGECVQCAPVFTADGKRFLLLDSDGFMHSYDFPSCGKSGELCETELREEMWGDVPMYEPGTAGEHVLVNLDRELFVLRPDDLRHSPLPLSDRFQVLENGLLVAWDGEPREVAEFRLTGRPSPVVAALDSKSARAVSVYCKARSRWRDITAEVGWLETRFPVVRE